MTITIKNQKKLKKTAANLRKQLSGRIKEHGYDGIAKEISRTLEAVKLRSHNLKLKNNFF